MKTVDLKFLSQKICDAKRILIAGHKNPDGDSLCSVLALAQLIKLNFSKDAVCAYDGNIPDMLDNMPMRSEMQYYAHIDAGTPFDLVFILDYGTKNHIGGVMPFVKSARYVIEIDHHNNCDLIGDLAFCDDASAATGEIIFNVANKLKWTRDAVVNDLLAASVLTDTGFFKYVRRGRVLRMMAELVDAGVDIEKISNALNNKPRKTVLTEAGVVSRAEFFYHGRLALAIIDEHDYKNLDGRGEMVLSLLGQIKGVEYVALLKRQKEMQTGVSLRGKTMPVDEIAAKLGGGGHTYAAGAVVADSLENVRMRVLELFRGAKK